MEKKYFFMSQIRKSLFLMTVLYVYYNTFSIEYLPSAKLSLGNCSREEMWNLFVTVVTVTIAWFVTELQRHGTDKRGVTKRIRRILSPALTMMDISGTPGPQSGQSSHQTMRRGVAANNCLRPGATKWRMEPKISFLVIMDLKIVQRL